MTGDGRFFRKRFHDRIAGYSTLQEGQGGWYIHGIVLCRRRLFRKHRTKCCNVVCFIKDKWDFVVP